MSVLIGGRGADNLLGTAFFDLILSGRGDDTIDAGGGNDVILAGKGDDIITGGAGSDFIDGGAGNDTAVFAGRAQDHGFLSLGPTLFVTDAASGDTDALIGIETLHFDNAEIFLDGRNNPVIADDVALSTDEDHGFSGDLLAASDAFDFERDTITISGVDGNAAAVGIELTLASGALVTVNADGTFVYDPNGQFEDLNTGDSATDTVTFDLSDGTNTITRTFQITIDGVDDNTAPVASDVVYEVSEDQAAGVYAFDADDADPEDDPGTLLYTSPGMQTPPFAGSFPNPTADFLNDEHGTFSLVMGDDVQALAEGETRDFAFTYWATDSHGAESNHATATIRITGENDAPTRPFGPIGIEIKFEDSGPAVYGYWVTDRDSDDNAATLTYAIDVPAGLSIVDNGDGSFKLDTNVGFDHLAEGQVTNVTINFTATDRHGASTAFSNIVGIGGVNDNPEAQNDGFQTDEASVVGGNLFDDNGNGADFDVDDGDSFAVTAIGGEAVSDGEVVTLDSGALVTINADGTFAYDPNGAFENLAADDTAYDSFTYTVQDTYGGTAIATATIEIAGADASLINA